MKAAAWFLFSVYVLALATPLMPWVEYAANYDYIAEVLCINQDAPEMQCNGQCHLKTQLEKATDTENTDRPLPVSTYKVPEFLPQEIQLAIAPRSTAATPQYGAPVFATLSGYPAAPFAPPWFAAC